jgi:hypothetical protein
MFLIPTMINMKKSRPVQQAVQHAITDGKTAVPQVEEMTVRLGYIKGNMSLTRKVMRFGIHLNLLLGIIKRIKSHQKTPVKMIFFATLADIFGSLYFLFDHPLYFTKTGFVKSVSPALQDRISWYSEFWWLLQCICEIFCKVVEIQDLQKDI